LSCSLDGELDVEEGERSGESAVEPGASRPSSTGVDTGQVVERSTYSARQQIDEGCYSYRELLLTGFAGFVQISGVVLERSEGAGGSTL